MKNTIYKKGFINYRSWKFRDSSLIDKVPVFDGVHPVFIQESVHSDEKTFVENFANPLYLVSREHAFMIIEEHEEKISFKIFWGNKIRREGTSWFKISKWMKFVTVNRKTGDVYLGQMDNYHKKKKFTKKIRRNFFLNDPLNSFIVSAKNLVSSFANQSGDIVSEAAEIFINSITQVDYGLDREQRLFKFYLDKRGFKYPNNFWAYTEFFHEKEFKKNLKKNSMKIVDSFMETKKISGKRIKKILHSSKKINFQCYEFAKNLFGEDWLNQDETLLGNIFNNNRIENFVFNLEISNFKNHLTKNELKNVFTTFKNLLSVGEINSYSFFDHIRMYVHLKQYGESSIKWFTNGENWEEFHKEHLDWTDKLEHYEKGTYKRIYPQYFYDVIQKPIDSYYPILLSSSHEYNEESQTQSNCVKGYVGRVSSIIISLRKQSKDSSTRATVEYRIHFLKNSKVVHSDRIQTLGKFNSRLDESWTESLLKLDEVVLSCVNREDYETVKLEKLCSNGTKLHSDSHFQDGILQWSYKPITQNFNLW